MYGFDVAAGALKSPAGFRDIMSYCHPVRTSEYTYLGILDWRGREQQKRLAAEAGPLEVTLSDGLISHRFVVGG